MKEDYWLSMKKMSYVLLFLFVCITTTYAQKDQKAAEILDAMSEKYKSVSAFKAQFTYTLESPSNGINESYDGNIAVKGTKFHLNLGEQEIINNGSTVWTYLKESNEVNISDYEPEASEITPVTIFNIYKTGYKYAFIEETREAGQLVEVIELVPEDKSKQIFKVRLSINKKDKSMKSCRVFEKNGNKYLYTIKKFTPAEIDDTYFAFDKSKYKGVEVIDLR